MAEPSGWLSQYESEADAAPHLTPSEELDLFTALGAGDASAAQMLLAAHKRLVLATARRRSDMTPSDFETAVRAGDDGLHAALAKFDSTKGFRFSTYATWWIRQAIGRSAGPSGSTIAHPNWN